MRKSQRLLGAERRLRELYQKRRNYMRFYGLKLCPSDERAIKRLRQIIKEEKVKIGEEE